MALLTVSQRLANLFSPTTVSAINDLARIDVKHVAKSDKCHELTIPDDCLDKLVEHAGSAVNFTIGIVSLSLVESDGGFAKTLPRRLAARLKRASLGIRFHKALHARHAGPTAMEWVDDRVPNGKDEKTELSNGSYLNSFQLESWSFQPNQPEPSVMETVDLYQLPSLKHQYPLIVIDLGIAGAESAEQLGRLCDRVYLSVPADYALSPKQSVRAANRMRRAGVAIGGCWSTRVA